MSREILNKVWVFSAHNKFKGVKMKTNQNIKVIYATDLDRTVIFSKRFLESKKINIADCLEVEKNGDYSSYACKEYLDKIKSIPSNMKFIPVTSRSIAEYSRVELSKYADYAIVSNGCHILFNGEILKDYEVYLKENNLITDSFKDTAIKAIKSLTELDKEPRVVDNAYIFAKVANPEVDIQEKIKQLELENDSITIQRNGNKIYVTPRLVTKGTALNWLREFIGASNSVVIGSGDSIMDKPLLDSADIGIVPTHGDILRSTEVYESSYMLVKQGPKGAVDTLKLCIALAR